MWSDAIKGRRVKVDGPQCGGLYKEDNGSIILWSGTDPDVKMNSFTWSTEENDWIFLGGQYNEGFNNWKGPINNGQFLCLSHILDILLAELTIVNRSFPVIEVFIVLTP